MICDSKQITIYFILEIVDIIIDIDIVDYNLIYFMIFLEFILCSINKLIITQDYCKRFLN